MQGLFLAFQPVAPAGASAIFSRASPSAPCPSGSSAPCPPQPKGLTVNKKFQFALLLVLAISLVLCCGYTHKKKHHSHRSHELYNFRSTISQPAKFEGRATSRKSNVVVDRAKHALGTPYRFGGEAPGGFDCSGLVRWAYRAAGVSLPRTAAEQSTVGVRVHGADQLKPGDILTFRRSGGGYHSGIYIGDNKFIHAPRTNTRVRVESCDGYFFKRSFIGARRVIQTNGAEAFAEAEEERSIRRSPGRVRVSMEHTRRHRHHRDGRAFPRRYHRLVD